MIANYYTLRHIALHLNQRFKGYAVSEVFSQARNELVLGMASPFGERDRELRGYVIVNCEPSENCLYTVESYARARRNSLDLFPHIIGRAIHSVDCHLSDRQIAFNLEGEQRLVVQVFGSKANVLLVDAQNRIVDAFLKPREVVGQQLSVRDFSERIVDASSLSKLFTEIGEGTLGVALKRFFPRFGTVLLTELLDRAGLARSESVDRLSQDDVQKIVAIGNSMVNELESAAKPRIYYDGPNAVEFSIIDLHHCRHLEVKEFLSLDEAIRTYRGSVRNLDHFTRGKSRIEHGLRKEIERISRTLSKFLEETESTDRAGEYEKMGELLKAHLHELQKGANEAIVENTLDGSNDLTSIPMDKNLTPAKNADRYFERAKKSRVATVEKKIQQTKLILTQSVLKTTIEKLGPIVSGAELEGFIDEHREVLRSLGLAKPVATKKGKDEEVPFRVFEVSGGFVVWAGKSGENNDLLSTRYTKGRDLWFHARSVGGSHVVLKYGSGKGEISKKAIQETAAIAAYYSKMKNSKLVPVSVCEGKYVRKPKGASAGTVTIERENVIFAEPRLPAFETKSGEK